MLIGKYSELRSNLQGLTELSMATTRRLDDIYYSILERVSQLHSTIDNLQQLSSLTRNLHHSFKQGSEELQTDLQDHVDGFGGFQSQKTKIDSLEARIKRSKDKAARLNDRLDAARKRIAALEVQEEIWQTTVTRKSRPCFARVPAKRLIASRPTQHFLRSSWCFGCRGHFPDDL
jgi:chromosome segregation ATPase